MHSLQRYLNVINEMRVDIIVVIRPSLTSVAGRRQSAACGRTGPLFVPGFEAAGGRIKDVNDN